MRSLSFIFPSPELMTEISLGREIFMKRVALYIRVRTVLNPLRP